MVSLLFFADNGLKYVLARELDDNKLPAMRVQVH